MLMLAVAVVGDFIVTFTGDGQRKELARKLLGL